VGVPFGKGVATHAVLESCATHREVRREMLTEVRVGQPLSRGMLIVRDADAFIMAKGNTGSRVTASANRILRGHRPWHARTAFIRELRDLRADHGVVVRVGKVTSRSR
jgi:hypothetical protein